MRDLIMFMEYLFKMWKYSIKRLNNEEFKILDQNNKNMQENLGSL